MKHTSLARRLVAGSIALMIGAAGAFALAAPAQAHGGKTHGFAKKASVEFVDDCEGTTVTVTSGKLLKKYKWTVSVDGDKFDSAELGKKESAEFFVPSDAGDEISVDFKHSQRGWPKTHKWSEPEDCDGDEPEIPETPLEGGVNWEFNCETITLTITNDIDDAVTFALVPSEGEAVEVTVDGNSTSEGVSFPASENLTFDVQVEGESVLDPEDDPIEITSEEWAELGCDEDGEGGELPVTGSSTLLIAGGALALLALGGGMYLVARRRRVSFTA